MILETIHKIAEKHKILISYDIIDQVANGHTKDVEKGFVHRFTYTVYVLESDGKEISIESYDNLEEGLKEGIEKALNHIKGME